MLTTPPVAGDADGSPGANASALAFISPGVGTETVFTSRTSRFTPSALVAGITALVLLVLGGVTAARAGIDSTLDDPVVTVVGFTATALLGVVEFTFGLVLLIAALAQARRATLFLGIVGGVVALVAVFQPTVGEGSLGVERQFAVVAAIVMGALIVSALMPTMRRRTVVRRTSDATSVRSRVTIQVATRGPGQITAGLLCTLPLRDNPDAISFGLAPPDTSNSSGRRRHDRTSLKARHADGAHNSGRGGSALLRQRR